MSFMSFLRTYVWKTDEPWVDVTYDDGKLSVRGYNSAFVAAQRQSLGSAAEGKTDAQVVDTFVGRENLEREEPRLEVLHSGIEEDGRIKMQLDWNRAFITLLASHGIVGESEDEAVQNYLKMVTSRDREEHVDEESFTRGQLEEAFAEMDRELESEMEEARKQAAKSASDPRKRRAKRRTNHGA